MRRSLVSGLLVVATASVSAAAYVRAFGDRVHLFGDDQFFYAWQANVVEAGSISVAGPRIGTPAMLALLQSVGIVPRLVPVLVAIALAVAAGLAVAVVGRRALGLPTWVLFPLGVAAATWSGTSRLASGYVANLLALTCFAVGLALASSRDVRPIVVVALGFASYLAAGLAHPAVLPFWFAIHIGWLILSIAGFVVARRDGGKWFAQVAGPLLSTGALVAGSLVTLTLLLGPLHSSVQSLGDLELVRSFFVKRLATEASRTVPASPLIVGGIVIGAWWARRAGEEVSRRALLAWGGVCLAGVALMIVSRGFPGHRILILATPFGVAAGLVAAGAAHLVLVLGRRWPRRLAIGVTALVCLGVVLATAFLGLLAFSEKVMSSPEDRALPARLAAAYVLADDGNGPIIVVFNPREARGALYWKVRLNIIRSFVGGRASQVHMYVGDPERLLSGRPTAYPAPADDLERVLDEISERTWPEVSQAFADGATVLVPRDYVGDRAWNELMDHGAPLASKGLAVPRGPIHPVAPIPRYEALDPLVALLRVLATLATMSVVGGGYAMLVSRGRSGSTGEAAALAPGLGAAILVIASSATVIAGHDVAGPVAISSVAAIGLMGWVLGVLRWLSTRPESSPPAIA